jgi:hypothetical protein
MASSVAVSQACKRGDDIDALGQLICMGDWATVRFRKRHAIKTQLRGQR